MTREQEIQNLHARYLVATAQRKHKTATLILARLCVLQTRQLKAEIRQDRKAS